MDSIMSAREKNPLLSIAIPTKNRYKTLCGTLNAMLSEFDDSVEFIICDNSDDNSSFISIDGINIINDKRVKYLYEERKLSIVDNTEIALSHCNGVFVTFIGDDDLVSPVIVEYLKSIIDSEIDAVSYPGAYYWWPDVLFSKKSYYNQPGAFWFPQVTDTITTVESKIALTNLLDGGGVSIGTLPKLYHGVIRSSVLQELKLRAGKYVLGASPDMALAVGLALLGVSTHIISTPLTVYGASKNSGGGWTAENKHHGNIQDQQHIPQFTKDHWSKFLPPVWSEQTIYPQTIFEVYMAFQKECRLNLDAFYASMFVNEKHLRSISNPYVIKYYKNNKRNIIPFSSHLLKKFLGRLKRYLETALKKRKFEVYHSFTLKDVLSFLKNRH